MDSSQYWFFTVLGLVKHVQDPHAHFGVFPYGQTAQRRDATQREVFVGVNGRLQRIVRPLALDAANAGFHHHHGWRFLVHVETDAIEALAPGAADWRRRQLGLAHVWRDGHHVGAMGVRGRPTVVVHVRVAVVVELGAVEGSGHLVAEETTYITR